VTKAVVETFGELKADLEQDGQRLDDFDLLIASTALMLGYRLVTNNERNFQRIGGLDVENWCQ
jgi:tRNA(fMet)-specific endonuclease VapC